MGGCPAPSPPPPKRMPLGLGICFVRMTAEGRCRQLCQPGCAMQCTTPIAPKSMLPVPSTPSPPSTPLCHPFQPLLHLQPGFGFITFEDERDADDAVAGLDGKNGWKVERARPSRRDGGGGFGGRGGGGYGGGGVSWGCTLERGVCSCSYASAPRTLPVLMACTLPTLPAVRWRWRRRRRPQVLPVWRAGPHRARRECWKEGDSWHGLMHRQGPEQLPRSGAHLLSVVCRSLACSINSARCAEAWRPTSLPAVPQRWWRWRPLWRWRRWWWLRRRWLRRRVSCPLHAGCWDPAGSWLGGERACPAVGLSCLSLSVLPTHTPAGATTATRAGATIATTTGAGMTGTCGAGRSLPAAASVLCLYQFL